MHGPPVLLPQGGASEQEGIHDGYERLGDQNGEGYPPAGMQFITDRWIDGRWIDGRWIDG